MTTLPVKVKVEYAASRSGNLIHDVDPDGRHAAVWRQDAGQWVALHWSVDADLYVKLRCRFPSWLRNPILIQEGRLSEFSKIESILYGTREMTMCPHCASLRG